MPGLEGVLPETQIGVGRAYLIALAAALALGACAQTDPTNLEEVHANLLNESGEQPVPPDLIVD